MNKYFISIYNEKNNHAGSKAVSDCEEILLQLGYKRFYIKLKKTKFKILNKVLSLIGYMKLFGIKSKSLVVLEHPLYINKKYINFIHWAKKLKKFNVILLIHDIESLRKMFDDMNDEFEKLDDFSFKVSNYIIVHNEKMKEYLISERNVSKSKIIVLGLFDYLINERILSSTSENVIVVAGNLDNKKSGYIYKLDKYMKKYKLNAYGVNCDIDNFSGNYLGSFSPEIIPNKLEGKYGLVWDGDQLETCYGTVGNYLKYNNSHKVSLYIVSELPIIVWKESALAKFIEKEKIGISISSLCELEKKIESIDSQEYDLMKKNIQMYAEKLSDGYFLKKAIKEVENKFEL